jgi:hypothetical protein
MRNRVWSLLLAAAAMLFSSLVLFAQAAPQTGAAKATPDLSGIWVKEKGRGFGFPVVGEKFTMLPWAESLYKTIRKGQTNPRLGGADALNPNLYPYCLPQGFPRIYDNSHPFELVQVSGRVYMNFEIDNQVRRIYTDGRKHHEVWPAMFMGDSVGRWEGDTLLVETANLNDLTWLDGLGHPHSDALRVEERIRRLKQDTLEIQFLFDDPKAYAKPWRAKMDFTALSPNADPNNWDMMETAMCGDEDSGEAYREAYRKATGGKAIPHPEEVSK